MLLDMAEEVDGGAALSDAMRRAEGFPVYVCGLVEVGERAGRTEEALSALSRYYESRARLDRRVRSALLYPRPHDECSFAVQKSPRLPEAHSSSSHPQTDHTMAYSCNYHQVSSFHSSFLPSASSFIPSASSFIPKIKNLLQLHHYLLFPTPRLILVGKIISRLRLLFFPWVILSHKSSNAFSQPCRRIAG